MLAARAAARLRGAALLYCAAAVYAALLLAALPGMLGQDSWLTLVGGREIVQHGLPQHDHLTAWTAGARWIDQQWLAQLAFYGLDALGGLRLALLGHAALLFAAFVLALAVARRRGASESSVCLVAALCIPAAPFALQLRAQSLGMLLFVCVLGLLVLDSHRPSRRVLLVLPLLAVWANVHGSVLLGALLVLVHAGTMAVSPRGRATHAWKLRSGLLLAGAPLCLFASPYAGSMGEYYRRIVANPELTRVVVEWRPSTPSRVTAVFYVLAFATVGLAARNPRRLTTFEQLALLLTLTSALWAIRSIVWFALADLVILPVLLWPAEGQRPPAPAIDRLRLRLGVAAVSVVVAGTAFVALRPASWFVHEWPTRSLPALHKAARDPAVRVFASDRYADWILWQVPALRGRVAYDVRFELLDRAQLRRLYEYRNEIGDRWRSAAAGYEVLAFDRQHERRGWVQAASRARARVVYADELIGLVAQPAPTRTTAAVTPR